MPPIDDTSDLQPLLPPALNGPSVPPLPPREPVPTRRRGYLAAHWYTEHSPPRSYWINTVLVGAGLRLLLLPLLATKWARHSACWALAAVGIAMLVPMGLALWQYVDIWRSATLSGAAGDRDLQAFLRDG